MENYRTDYKDYTNYITIMISTDRLILNEKSAVRTRMVGYSNLYKELHIIILSNKKLQPTKISANCTIYSTNSFVRWNYVTDARKIGKKIVNKMDKNLPLLVSCENPFETALVGKCLVNLHRNSQLLLQIHTDLFSPHFRKHSIVNKINLFISKFTISHAQVIRVVSKKIADSLVVRGISTEKIIVKPITVNVDYIKNNQPTFNLHEKYPQFKKIILMVSRLEAEKNIPMALDAIKIVLEKMPDTGLIIVGSGSNLRSLQKHAYKLKIEPNIAFVGWQTDLIPYYKGCDIFLCTSWYEGYGMVLKEAEVAGCRIVSTDVGIAREVGASIVGWKAEEVAERVIENLK